MGDWSSSLNADIIDWLLEEDDPSIRYWTLKDLLQESETDPKVERAKKKIPVSQEMQLVFAQNEINGGPFWSRADGNIYWGSFSTGSVLCHLAETGLTKEDRRIAELAKFLFQYQSKQGFLKLSPKGPGWWSCFTATVLGALLRFGYVGDGQVQQGIDWLLETQRPDGGWYCTKNALKGGPKERLESCPNSVLNVLWAFMTRPELRDRQELVPAVEFLLRHWETKVPIPPVDRGSYGIGSRFKRIRYPLFEYHLLKYVYVLSHYDHALKDDRFREAVELLISKRDSQGRWIIDKPYRGWEELEFGKEGCPSKWATLNSLRILKRTFYSCSSQG